MNSVMSLPVLAPRSVFISQSSDGDDIEVMTETNRLILYRWKKTCVGDI